MWFPTLTIIVYVIYLFTVGLIIFPCHAICQSRDLRCTGQRRAFLSAREASAENATEKWLNDRRQEELKAKTVSQWGRWFTKMEVNFGTMSYIIIINFCFITCI